MAADLVDAGAVTSAINALSLAALAYVGRQFSKNRSAGRTRDQFVADLAGKVDALKLQVERLTQDLQIHHRLAALERRIPKEERHGRREVP